MTDLVTKFVELTNCATESAISYLDKYEWDFEEALQHYFDDGPENNAPSNTPLKSDIKKPTVTQDTGLKDKEHGVITLDSILKSQGKNDDENSQAYYAGGSEKSGQLILGPASMKNKKNLDNVVENIFKSALDHGGKEISSNPNLAPKIGKKSPKSKKRMFGGKGHVLGDSSAPSHSSKSNAGPVKADSSDSEAGSYDSEDDAPNSSPTWGTTGGSCCSHGPTNTGNTSVSDGVVLRLFSDGFTVDDGPLRRFSDPENGEFLDAILRGELPPEIANLKMALGGAVNMVMEDHRNEKYSETDFSQKAKTKPFTGQGYMLGSPSPGVTFSEATEPEKVTSILKSSSGSSSTQSTSHPLPDGSIPVPSLDESLPTTAIQLRLADGTRVSLKCNTTNTIGQIKEVIKRLFPKYSGADFKLLTPFPHKELTDDSVTLEKANLLNTVIVQKLK